jgi:hypothetical protein
MLAISTSDSPTNLATGWTRHLLQVNRAGITTDFTTLGMDANGLYVTTLAFNISTNVGHTVVAVKKPEIYAGVLITNRLDIYSTNTLPVWTIQPAVNFDDVATNSYAWFVAKGPPDLSTNYRGGAICYRRLQWEGTNVAWADTNWVALSDTVPTYRDYYDLDGTNLDVSPGPGTAIIAPQTNGAGIGINLQGVGSRFATTVIRNGSLWTCQAVGLSGTNGIYAGDQSGTNVDRSGIQWLKLNVDAAAGLLSYNTHGRIFDRASSNPSYYYFPSLMVNCAGDAVMGFSGSSTNTYVSAFYAWRSASGSIVAAPRPVREGEIPLTFSRAGDFSATTLDPTDDWSFWTVQEYADPSGDQYLNYPWKTVIARIRPLP